VDGLTRFHATARQAPLTVVCPARKKDPLLLIEDGGRAPQTDASLFADPLTIENLCHFVFPFELR
jgi:hypothetical protein